MFRNTKKFFAVALIAVLAVGFAMPTDAEARRYRRRVVRVAPVVAAPVAVVRAPVVVRAPYVGVGVGYRGVRVAAPRAGVYVGW